MQMKRLSMLVAAVFALPVNADMQPFSGDFAGASNQPITSIAQQRLVDRIDVAEWSLRNSSLANQLSDSLANASISLLARARAEIGAGNLRTAEELVRRASQPLVRMDGEALQGKHPDQIGRGVEIRQTLISMLDAAAGIATEKSAPTDFIVKARQDLATIDALSAGWRTAEANNQAMRLYAEVQQQVVALRNGDRIFIETSKTASSLDWRDGLNRIEERRQMTDYLLIDAETHGRDTGPLSVGVQAAENSVAQATALAGQQRWEQAIQTLELAYAQYENSWRSIGVDW